MIDVKTLKPGDKVRIVDHRTDAFNNEGYMDKYLGCVVTVDDIDEKFFFIKEDDRHLYHHFTYRGDQVKWFFTGEMVEYLVIDDGVENEQFDASVLSSILFACGGTT